MLLKSLALSSLVGLSLVTSIANLSIQSVSSFSWREIAVRIQQTVYDCVYRAFAVHKKLSNDHNR